jgi:capsular polysaccharide transport system permease protein
MSQHHEEINSKSLVSLEASRKISERLTSSARKLRFSTSSRSNLYKVVGLRPRLSDRIFTLVLVLLTFVLLVVPNVFSIAYYGIFASDQYQSESRFTVRSSTPAMGKDQVARVTGIPSVKIVQDTQIVVNFIESHEMLDFLREQNVDLKEMFGRDSIDWWARLPKDANGDEVKKYWDSMVDTSVSAASGIVSVKVRAFSPQDASTLVSAVLKASELVVNRVNDRIWKDVTSTAEKNLTDSQVALEAARKTIAEGRNRDGVLTVEGSAQVINSLVTVLETDRLKLQQRYESQRGIVSDNSPQMRVLLREMRSKEQQIADLKKQLAGSGSGRDAQGRNLADISQDLSQLQLALGLAEQQFSSSVRTLEQIRFISRQQLLYLDSFLSPRVPDEAQYPKRGMWIVITLIASTLAWLVALGLASIARTRLMQ